MESQAYDAFFAVDRAAGLKRSNCPMHTCTAELSRLSATDRVASPISAASLPVKERPVRISSAAFFWPTSAPKAVQATGGKHPSLISGNPHSASSLL